MCSTQQNNYYYLVQANHSFQYFVAKKKKKYFFLHRHNIMDMMHKRPGTLTLQPQSLFYHNLYKRQVTTADHYYWPAGEIASTPMLVIVM